MHNPLKDEIKSKLIMAYELAVKACVVINQRFNCTLSEDEIAYFALHINLSLEQKSIIFIVIIFWSFVLAGWGARVY